MFQHKGVTANNNAEAFNFKMSSKKKISRHPNPHILVFEQHHVTMLLEIQISVKINKD